MTHQHAAVKEAIYVYRHRDNMDRQTRVDKARSLAEWGCFSNRQIGKLVGLHPHEVSEYTGKKDHTGGRLKPESLPHVLNVIEMHNRGEVNHSLVKRALEAGCSSTMLARLTGRPQTTLSWQARQVGRLAA